MVVPVFVAALQANVPWRSSGQELDAVEGWHGGEDDAGVGQDSCVHESGLAVDASNHELLRLEDPLWGLNLLSCLAGVFF